MSKTAGVVKQDKLNGHKPGGVTGKGFMPGKSGNPGGRPKKENTLVSLLDMYSAHKLPKELPFAWVKGLQNVSKVLPPPQTIEQLIAQQIIGDALDGNEFARNVYLDRRFGKAAQPIEGDLNVNATGFEGMVLRRNGNLSAKAGE